MIEAPAHVLEFFKLMMIPTSLSFAGSLFIMVSCVLFRKRIDKLHSLIFFLALSDWCASAWWMASFISNETANSSHWKIICLIRAYGLQFFFLQTWSWAFFFCLRLFSSNILESEWNPMWIFHLVSWLVPTTVCIVSVLSIDYSDSIIWCWANDLKLGYLISRIILGLMFLIELSVFVIIIFRLYSASSNFGQVESHNRAAVLRFSLYLVVPLICWGWGLVLLLFKQYLSPLDEEKVSMISVIGASCQGFINAVVYGMDRSLWALWRKKIYKCFNINKEEKTALLRTNIGVNAEIEYAPPVAFDSKKSYDFVDN